MTRTEEPYRSPFPPYPGGGPPHDTTPEEGIGEMWIFFWLALASTLIIAAAGIGTWLYLGRPTL